MPNYEISNRKQLRQINHRQNTILQNVLIHIGKILIGGIFALNLTFSVELIQRESFKDTFEWAKLFHVNFWLGYLLIASVFLFFYFIFSRVWAGCFVTGVIFIGSALVNYFKMIIRGDPFLPWDLKIGKEAGNILQHVQIKFTPMIWTVIGVTVLCVVVTFFIKTTKLDWRIRILGSVATFIGILLCFSYIYINPKALKEFRIQDVNWDQAQNYERNGFLMGFLINVKSIVIEQPKGYSKQQVEELLTNTKDYNSEKTGQKPNIIMIMSEAFWDPTQFEDLQYTTEVIPTISKLRKEAVSGWVLSPQFGGSTANPEFESLTGHSMAFLPYGAIAYEQYIKKPMPSLVSYLREEGYSTVAIHPYVRWFWDRENVYPRLGFEKYFFREDFKDPEMQAGYISDMSAVKEIIHQYEENEKQQDKPFFSFLVSMENHGTYEDKPFKNRDIKVTNTELSAETQHILNNYVQGVKDADAALGYLIDYFKKVEEPTVVIMFGDHLPTLGNNYSVYKELGYVGEGDFSPEEYVKLYTTPFVMWNNYDIKKEDIGIMNTHYIAPYVLNKSGMELPKYFEFLLDLKEKVPAYTSFVSLDEKGVPQIQPSEAMKKEKQKHWMLQYDTMFGKGYVKEEMFKK